ncbi:MAG: hypothetical protein NDI95_04045 [Acidovorax soli]|uniref:hypothetical protein n=1 Tax=Acidovorax soli TaxID=592050 RepID=UPI0026EC3CDE|nr:hypothetical protein [Acidovorax soli]MCM2345802.1 hypothetical protein [Acidovorax soli]
MNTGWQQAQRAICKQSLHFVTYMADKNVLRSMQHCRHPNAFVFLSALFSDQIRLVALSSMARMLLVSART